MNDESARDAYLLIWRRYADNPFTFRLGADLWMNLLRVGQQGGPESIKTILEDLVVRGWATRSNNEDLIGENLKVGVIIFYSLTFEPDWELSPYGFAAIL